VTQTPKLIILKGGRQKYIMPSESSITTDSISLFFNQVANGEVTPYLKSAPVPTEDTPVKILVGSNFNSVVYGDHREYLVKFYAPWCGHCKSIAPHYESAAKALADNSNIVLAKFDGTENEV
jgi:thiol-disulfide isomerase/thioredoxin